MRKFIDLVANQPSQPLRESLLLLLERKEYEDMLAPIKDFLVRLCAFVDTGEGVSRHTLEKHSYGRARHQIAQFNEMLMTAQSYASRMKRRDRAIWFTRVSRVLIIKAICQELGESLPDDFKFLNEIRQLKKKIMADYVRVIGTDQIVDHNNWTFVTSRNMTDNLGNKLVHAFSLPIHAIQTYVFTNQPTQQVIDEFNELERVWKEERQGALDMINGDKIVLDFGDGWVWMLLNRGSCRDEAEAMGHCGNAGSYDGERILSLRKRVEIDGQVKWRPSLTFILDAQGRLGEMKGRGNDKPSERYHPYIIALLKLPLIKAIKGGGYLPENNFSLSDLTGEQQIELANHNSNFTTFEMRYVRGGDTKELREALVGEYGGVVYDVRSLNTPPIADEWVCYGFSDVDDLISEMGDETFKYYHERDNWEQEIETTDEDLVEAFDALPANYQEKLTERARNHALNNNEHEEFEEEYENDETASVIKWLEDNEDDCYRALHTAAAWGQERAMGDQIAEKINNAIREWSPDFTQVVYTMVQSTDGKEVINWNAPVKLKSSMKQACIWADRRDDDGVPYLLWEEGNPLAAFCGEDKKLTIEVPYDGFHGFDEAGAVEGFEAAIPTGFNARPLTPEE